ncbi:Hypothetical predicted protein [Octopus vulgaris]|uniref:Uncharacterized protein n=1 Tax=Octopus vulgaris TaxID=6645 RepID=A0AA36BCH9_OCTVU|nr:Hypothetical predicted protein [Octopus vulgaris]
MDYMEEYCDLFRKPVNDYPVIQSDKVSKVFPCYIVIVYLDMANDGIGISFEDEFQKSGSILPVSSITDDNEAIRNIKPKRKNSIVTHCDGRYRFAHK